MALPGDTIRASEMPGLLVAFLQRNVTAQTITPSVETAISFDVALWDRQGGWAASPNPSRYTPTLPGWYEVTGMVGYAGDATVAGSRRARWLFNGAAINGGFHHTDLTHAGTHQVLAPSLPINFNGTTDYVELMAWQSTAANLDTTLGVNCPWMKLIYLGAA